MLACDDIGISFGRHAVLRGLSLGVGPGELVAVIGPNGAGKTTLFQALSGTLPVDRGDVRLDERPLRSWPRSVLARRRAVLQQASALSFPFRVLDVVLLGRGPHAGRSTRAADLRVAEQALHETDMLPLADRLYTTLSGGEKQRVHLARVLAQVWRSPADAGVDTDDDGATARYLLLDEPTNNLDLSHQQAIMATARRFAEAGNGVLAILHDPNLAACYADRVCVIADGRVIEDGPADRVFKPALFKDTFGLDVTLLRHPARDRPVVVPA